VVEVEAVVMVVENILVVKTVLAYIAVLHPAAVVIVVFV
jgi:hypothetical protein